MSDLTEYFTWTELDPVGGEGVILAILGLGPLLLVTRDKRVATEVFRPLAEGHREASGHRVRLLHWTQPEEIEVLK